MVKKLKFDKKKQTQALLILFQIHTMIGDRYEKTAILSKTLLYEEILIATLKQKPKIQA